MASRSANIAIHWFLNLLKYTLGKSNYLTLYPPFFSSAVIFSKQRKRFMRIALRPQSTDVYSLIENFQKETYKVQDFIRCPEILKTYQGILQSGRRPLIIDCGANNGMSALYFSDVWPEAKIVAIEPDEDNIRMLRLNALGSDCDICHAGITATAKRFAIIDPNADHNAIQIIANKNGEIEGVTISDIIHRFSPEQYAPFFVKVDIEGFESDLFETNTDWIDDTPIIAIELHDWMLPGEANSKNFLNSMAGRLRDFMCVGDIVFSIQNTCVVENETAKPQRSAEVV